MGEIREAADAIDDAVRNQNAAAAVQERTAKLREVANRLEAAGIQDLAPLKARMENAFTYHAPKGTQQERYVTLRDAGKSLAMLIVDNVPDSPEKSTALAKLREAVMWANAGIACNE